MEKYVFYIQLFYLMLNNAPAVKKQYYAKESLQIEFGGTGNTI